MAIETTRFGSLDVPAEAVITFTQPIIGFPDRRRFVLVDGPEKSALTWLQSVEDPALAFLMMDPRALIADYAIALSQAELVELAATHADEVAVYTLVVVPSDPAQVRTNLRAPILIHARHRLGKQTVLDGSDYPIQYFLAQARPQNDEAEEVSHARADS